MPFHRKLYCLPIFLSDVFIRIQSACLSPDENVKTAKLLHFAAFLASPARFERTAFRLGGERSILLSYGNKAAVRAAGAL